MIPNKQHYIQSACRLHFLDITLQCQNETTVFQPI